MAIDISSRQLRFQNLFKLRIFTIIAIIIFLNLIFIIRLCHLQINDGEKNFLLSQRFVNRKEFTEAPRGFIYSRDLEPIVENIELLDYTISPRKFDSLEQAQQYISALCLWIHSKCEVTMNKLNKKTWRRALSLNKDIVIFSVLTRPLIERILNFQYISHYGQFLIKSIRKYNLGSAAAHITGYIGQPSRRDIDRNLAEAYQTIGKGGLESHYDHILRGKDGLLIKHRIIDKEVQVISSSKGNDIVTSIHSGLQKLSYELLEASGKRGPIFIFQPRTGEVLSLVSYPSYNPNILSNDFHEETRKRHLKQIQDYNGFLDLAIQTKSPPASTFKPLLALAALEAEKKLLNDNIESGDKFHFKKETRFTCNGGFLLKSSIKNTPDTFFSCLANHSKPNLMSAIAHSCNSYFFQLGYEFGIENINYFLNQIQLDQVTQIDIPGEIKSFYPTKKWKNQSMISRWYDGDTVNVSVGQGFLQTTPIAMGLAYASIVNCGKVYKPQLLQKVIEFKNNKVIQDKKSEILYDHPFDPANCAVIQRSLREVVENGTARSLNNFSVPIAGKTGTVQLTKDKREQTHSWFIGYAPFDAPPENVAIAVVFLEKGGFGSGSSAYIAGQLLDFVHKRKILVNSEKQEQQNRLQNLGGVKNE